MIVLDLIVPSELTHMIYKAWLTTSTCVEWKFHLLTSQSR